MFLRCTIQTADTGTLVDSSVARPFTRRYISDVSKELACRPRYARYCGTDAPRSH